MRTRLPDCRIVGLVIELVDFLSQWTRNFAKQIPMVELVGFLNGKRFMKRTYFTNFVLIVTMLLNNRWMRVLMECQFSPIKLNWKLKTKELLKARWNRDNLAYRKAIKIVVLPQFQCGKTKDILWMKHILNCKQFSSLTNNFMSVRQ